MGDEPVWHSQPRRPLMRGELICRYNEVPMVPVFQYALDEDPTAQIWRCPECGYHVREEIPFGIDVATIDDGLVTSIADLLGCKDRLTAVEEGLRRVLLHPSVGEPTRTRCRT